MRIDVSSPLRKALRILILGTTGLFIACSNEPPREKPKEAYGTKPVYDYPINNPFAATIIAMPPAGKVDYSSLPKPRVKTITLFKDRPIPEGYWYQDGFRYSELLQPGPAPLVYVIAGTGADSRAEDSLLLADILYTGGYSVVLLPSPTNPNFIINASSNFIPGDPAQDGEDLYRAMRQIDAKLSQGNRVTDRMLVGYSLGGWHAAYVAKLDDGQHALNFSRALLINPPLSLYSSMKVLDGYLYQSLPNGINSADRFIKGFVQRLTNVSQSSDALDFSNERLLIEAYDKYQPSDAKLATLVGLSFRLAAVDMTFTSDVMGHEGYIFPKNQEFTTSTYLGDYMGVALRTSFRNYMDDVFIPQYRKVHPAVSRDAIITSNSLESLSGYIAGSGKLRLITNKDDIILAPGESDRLIRLFGPNTAVFPNGGHLGNLGHPAVAWQIIQFLRH